MAETLISCLIADLPRLMPAKLVEESQELLELLKKVRSVLPGVLANSIKNEDWLTKLDDAVWEADKIVDEFRYAELLTEAKASGYQQNDDNVKAGIFSHFNINNNLKLPFLKIGRGGVQLDGYKSKIGSVINKFDAIVSRMGSIRVNQNEATIIAAAQKPQEKIFQNPTDIGALIVGLDEKRDKIVEYLLDPSNIICETIVTVSISGESGTGIILAQSICNDARIINYFDCIIWVDLGIQPNAAKIAKNIIDQAIGKDCYLSEDDPDLLQHRLYQELSGKRYLLVWNIKWVRDNEINKVLNKLKLWVERCGGKGNSQIVVCTNKIHHEKPGLPNYACDLKTSEDDMSMLFAKTAFYNDQGTPQKKLQVAKEIVRGCGKSMQLVNMMGNLMRFKKHRAEWDEIINYIKLGGKPDSQKLVNLCLLNLSSETKQCLQFCCIFPKGYYMDKEVLIELWMANGLFTSDEPTLLEQKGNSIFNELVFRNLLEDVKRVPGDKYGNKHEYGSRVVCKMAEILHNLASVPECCNNNAHKNIGPFKKLYCYLSIPNDSPEDIPRLLQEYPHARTLVFLDEPFVRTVNYSVLPENCLRALHLRSAVFDKDRFEVKQLTPLRYLDLSGSRITKLPETFSSLLHLQTLNLSRCLLLCELPKDMRCMNNLRHLFVHGCPKLKKMPVHLRQLKYLTVLTTYIVGESAGNGIDEIKELHLSGLLELYNLSKVKDAKTAEEVKLHLKTNLERLTLCWGEHQVVMLEANNDMEVLEALEPHNGLKVLKIQQYGGNKFATWLDNRIAQLNLVELHLIGCPNCETLPAVWKLSSLKILCLKYMPSITCFAATDVRFCSEPFPKLKRLVLVSMKNIEKWHDGEVVQGASLSFPVLDEMEIIHCPVLKTMPSVPMLRYLTISTENHSMVTSVVDMMTQSKRLIEVNMARGSYSDNEELSALVTEVDGQNNHKLRVMRLNSTNCFFMSRIIPNLRLGFWRLQVSLENLDISNCSSIVAWPLEEFRHLSKLKRLALRMCPNLTGSFPKEKLQGGEVHLPQLQALEFYRCRSLKVVPRCYSILYLELDECPGINSVSGFNNLEMLYLSCTRWTSLPTGFEDLKK